MIGGLLAVADVPPKNTQPLSKVLTALEKQGLSPIVEASFDDGVWEVEGYRGDKPVEVHVDPGSLSIISEHPDSTHERPALNALAASAIVQQLEEQHYRPILEIDWDHADWEVEALRDGRERDLRVSATGEITSDRADD
jgi:hypothetical protein